MLDGYIKLHRKVLNNELFLEMPFDRWRAFEFLLLNARYKQTDIMIKGKTIHLDAGQLIFGEDALAIKWGWSRGKVRRFLEQLESLNMIHRNGTPYGTVITIENYTLYQGERTSNGTPFRTGERTSNGTPFRTGESTADGTGYETAGSTAHGTADGTGITIENYTLYQGERTSNGTPFRTGESTADGTGFRTGESTADGTGIKKEKKEKKDNNIIINARAREGTEDVDKFNEESWDAFRERRFTPQQMKPKARENLDRVRQQIRERHAAALAAAESEEFD